MYRWLELCKNCQELWKKKNDWAVSTLYCP